MRALRRLALAATCAVSAAACAPGPTPTAAPTRIRVGLSGTVMLRSDVPFAMAHDELRSKGYVVDVVFYESNDISAEALVRGGVDLAIGSVRNTWQAIEKGAAITTIMDRTANASAIVAKSELRQCSDLRGKRLAMQSQTSATALLVKNYIKAHCPDAAPTYLIIANNDNRIAALLAGELDAAALSLEYLGSLTQRAPGRFGVLANLAIDSPGLMLTSVSASSAFAAAHPAALKDYVRATLAAQRQLIGNPEQVRKELVDRKMVQPADAETTAKALTDAAVWDPNGGMSRESLERTVKYVVEAGEFKTPPKIDKIADFTFLDQALVDIGRR